MLLQLLRCCVAGFDEVLDRALYRTQSDLRSALLRIEQELEAEQQSMQGDGRIERLSQAVLDLLEPFYPRLRSEWGAWAVTWGTASVKREIAHRSLQLYRSLSPPVSSANLAALLGRLGSSIADPEVGISKFNVEIIDTLKASFHMAVGGAVLPVKVVVRFTCEGSLLAWLLALAAPDFSPEVWLVV